MRRSLSGPYVDLVRDGVPEPALRRNGDRAVWGALVRVACSAVQRGHAYSDFVALVTDPRSTLGRQVAVRKGRTVKPLRVHRTLSTAWEHAVAWVEEHPAAFTPDDVREHVDKWRAVLEDPDADLTATDRAVIATACEIATTNGTTRPAMPWRAVVAATGLPERTVKSALARLDRRGLLVREDRGRPGTARPRAALYRLPSVEAVTSYLYPGTGSVGPLGQVCGTPPVETPGTPGPYVGPPVGGERRSAVLTVTVTGEDPEAVLDLLARLGRESGVEVAAEVEDRGGVVVPMRPTGT